SSSKTQSSSSGHGSQGYTTVSYNKSILDPLHLEVDPNIHHIRAQEKDQIKSLNNKFASFIDKVRYLEQQNKMLETKWNLLQARGPGSKSNVDGMFDAYLNNLRRQHDFIRSEKDKLLSELGYMQGQVEDLKTKYEDEVNRRTGLENDFVYLKKDVDEAFLIKSDLEDKLAGVTDEVNFLRSIFDEEISEMQTQIKDTSVIVELNNSRNLDLDNIITEVKSQYEQMAQKSRNEAEAAYRSKVDDLSTTAGKYGDEVRTTKSKITDLTRTISRYNNEIETLKGQRTAIETNIREAEERGELSIRDAKARVMELETALQRAKQDMAKQLREYQKLMNIKLGLDIEIATYRKLLEGEEGR
uniref:IF rod domain-containing protein n=2 Tax=Latimeria chalumnae TaxID=7897 RepID=H3BEL9_LATCH